MTSLVQYFSAIKSFTIFAEYCNNTLLDKWIEAKKRMISRVLGVMKMMSNLGEKESLTNIKSLNENIRV